MAGGAGPSAHPPISAQAAMAAAYANGMVVPTPPHSGAGFTPAGLPVTSGSASAANVNLLAFQQGLLPPHTLQMLGVRGVAPSSGSALPLPLPSGSKEEARRPSEHTNTGALKSRAIILVTFFSACAQQFARLYTS